MTARQELPEKDIAAALDRLARPPLENVLCCPPAQRRRMMALARSTRVLPFLLVAASSENPGGQPDNHLTPHHVQLKADYEDGKHGPE